MSKKSIDVPDLPEPKKASETNSITNGRICNKCGKEGRIVSNYLGINVHCDTCKTCWPIGGAIHNYDIAVSMPRGLAKRTLIEPDISIAFENDEDRK